ncbi:D-lactate dehydrogenase [Chitinophaga terrae (ex Kim and Jung 2007)]|uniref:D-lactate dehydrogenase n=1 Tax=Chitinophaga terrae (ex Kim and Jung 2007) TaxID=408074 RepID=A0A1H4CSF8_9BACT|nr:2-hydroxyacid dehydrogenase [Chitinophaga terrae (ex Kim and Jung 2007)]GEP90413.1 lactate dehydrogenase [Chitinophaga terrae (ex Kim and Jung 2007)]SEA63042.1 D-lactate dehydrogenase [Chitinophaga terrae (ex Kim and Jung 2007)]
MNILFFSAQSYDREYFTRANLKTSYNLRFLESPLNVDNTALIKNEKVICVFVNDQVNAEVIAQLKEKGVELIALRCAGFNNVDLAAAAAAGIRVVRVPAYSPHAVAEHAVTMLLSLNRKIYKSYNRIRDNNFTLAGLEGFDLYGKTVGVIGTGNIGMVFCWIMLGFGCKVIAHDVYENKELVQAGVVYKSLQEVITEADVISLHCPLMPETKHMINRESIASMKKGVILVNTSRGGLIDTVAVVDALKKGHIGALAIDVYEQEEHLFFQDFSDTIIMDDVLSRLTTFPNVLITAHQGFFTREALTQIAEVTLNNIRCYSEKKELTNEVK